MEATVGKASLRDAAVGTGIAVDKMLALTGQTPAVQIANIVLPTEEERAERRPTFTTSLTKSQRASKRGRPPGKGVTRQARLEMKERAERRAYHDQLDAIARKLAESRASPAPHVADTRHSSLEAAVLFL